VEAVENGGTSIYNAKMERGKPFRQIVAAFIANIGTINTGLIFGFSAVAVPQLEAADSFIQIDEYQASWIASLSSAATPIGCIFSGYIMDSIGRRKTLLLTEVPLIIGWLLIAFASNVEMIYAGRILCGLGSGLVGAPARVYTSECSQPHLRGTLTALAGIGISLGVLLQYTIGAFTTWQIAAGLSAVIPLLAFIFMLPMPETPNYLVSRSKTDDAKKSLAKLRGSSYNLQREVDQLQQFANKNNCQHKATTKELIQALFSPSALKPFGILFSYFMIYQFSGVNTITFYAVEIFRDSGTTWDKNTCTIVLGVIRFVFTIAGAMAMRRLGRRTLSFISFVGCGITMISLGFYLRQKELWDAAFETPHLTWLPALCIFAFQICCSIGFLVVPWVMIGELYPMKVRGILGGLSTCSAHMFVFIVVKTYPFLSHLIGKHGCFITYGCISLIGTVFFYFHLPETRGKTLQEIEDYFSGRISSASFKNQNKPPTGGISTIANLSGTKPTLAVEKDKLLA